MVRGGGWGFGRRLESLGHRAFPLRDKQGTEHQAKRRHGGIDETNPEGGRLCTAASSSLTSTSAPLDKRALRGKITRCNARSQIRVYLGHLEKFEYKKMGIRGN